VSASVEELEREIAQTRADAVRTVEALRYKLSPKALTQEVLHSGAALKAERFLAGVLPWIAVALTAAAALRWRARRQEQRLRG
jgi:hypothetical protein